MEVLSLASICVPPISIDGPGIGSVYSKYSTTLQKDLATHSCFHHTAVEDEIFSRNLFGHRMIHELLSRAIM